MTLMPENMFFTSVQCIEAANKAKQLIFKIRHSFQDLSESAFIPLYETLVRPRLEYVMPACSSSLVADINNLERSQRLATRLVAGLRDPPRPPPPRLKRDCSERAFIPCSGDDFGLT